MAERECARHADHQFVEVDGKSECAHCGIGYAEALRGFGSNGTAYEMPPSRSHRKKSAVAKRFGQAFGDGD